jgi:hypothetical protein
MDKGVYWEIFEKTGSVEAFLTYHLAEESSSAKNSQLEELGNKDVEGEK